MESLTRPPAFPMCDSPLCQIWGGVLHCPLESLCSLGCVTPIQLRVPRLWTSAGDANVHTLLKGDPFFIAVSENHRLGNYNGRKFGGGYLAPGAPGSVCCSLSHPWEPVFGPLFCWEWKRMHRLGRRLSLLGLELC